MDTKEEINKAISAHSKWKFTLRKAIETGVCESTPERVKQDCNCSLGKWLHYRLDESLKLSPLYIEIVEAHAAFHQEAGSILELALSGQHVEAEARIERGSVFAKLSASLVKKLGLWQEQL